MFSRIMAGVILTLTTLVGVLAAPAQASTPASSPGAAVDRYVNLGPADACPDGYFCAYEGTWLEGNAVAFFSTESNWGAIPTQFRWINNRARSGVNLGFAGSFEDVWAYPLANFGNDPRWPAVCIETLWGDGPIHYNPDWGALRPESNRWVASC